jgi:hypothetical protein
MRLFLTIIFCTFFAALFAQNKTGVWYGAIVFEPDGVREADTEPRIRVDAQTGRIVNVPPIYAGLEGRLNPPIARGSGLPSGSSSPPVGFDCAAFGDL